MTPTEVAKLTAAGIKVIV